jgi:hypothetical protein
LTGHCLCQFAKSIDDFTSRETKQYQQEMSCAGDTLKVSRDGGEMITSSLRMQYMLSVKIMYKRHSDNGERKPGTPTAFSSFCICAESFFLT